MIDSFPSTYSSSTFLNSHFFSPSHLTPVFDSQPPSPPLLLVPILFPLFSHSNLSCQIPVRTRFRLSLQTPLKHPSSPYSKCQNSPKGPPTQLQNVCNCNTGITRASCSPMTFIMTYRLSGQSSRKTHIGDSHRNNGNNSGNSSGYSCPKSSKPWVKKPLHKPACDFGHSVMNNE